MEDTSGIPGGEAAADTVGGAVAVAAELPPEEAEPLLRQAFDAYSTGLTTAAGVGAAVLVLAAIGIGIALRGTPTGQSEAGDPAESGSTGPSGDAPATTRAP